MKTFRIKVYNEETCRSSFEFIFLKNCKRINLSYSLLEQSTRFELSTIDEKLYTLSTTMKPLDFELFMEYAARDYDTMKSELTKAKRDMKLEKMFTLE